MTIHGDESDDGENNQFVKPEDNWNSNPKDCGWFEAICYQIQSVGKRTDGLGGCALKHLGGKVNFR